MIMNMKKYENPMLQVVSINKSDIIVTSPVVEVSTNAYDPTKGGIYAPGQRGLDDWDAGY
jgi:hypothetical protein